MLHKNQPLHLQLLLFSLFNKKLIYHLSYELHERVRSWILKNFHQYTQIFFLFVILENISVNMILLLILEEQ